MPTESESQTHFSARTAPLLVLSDENALMEAAAARITDLCRHAIASRGRFAWALSGGSTPRKLYALLATARFVSRIDWTRVHFFWGDERCVAADHAESNYRMVRETLFDVIKPDPERVHRMLGEQDPERAASCYEEMLRGFFDTELAPSFDLILLGMGADGHTASLFPGTAALYEKRRWVVVNRVTANAPPRLTLTPVMINAADNALFLVSGANKASCLKRVLQGPADGEALPARLIRPARGQLQWMVDADAASQLELPP
jgi:6-phosphogluconolactonase